MLIPVGLAALVGIGIVVYLIWRVSAVQLSDDSTKSSRDVADAEDAKAAAETAKESVARISDTAIISSIAFPSIFQISITFEMPFGFPPVLVQFAEWVTSIVSLDLGQVGSPECAMENDPESALLFKFLLTVSARSFALSLSLCSIRRLIRVLLRSMWGLWRSACSSPCRSAPSAAARPSTAHATASTPARPSSR